MRRERTHIHLGPVGPPVKIHTHIWNVQIRVSVVGHHRSSASPKRRLHRLMVHGLTEEVQARNARVGAKTLDSVKVLVGCT